MAIEVFKRLIKGKPSKCWYVRFTEGGKQVLKSSGLTDRRQAELWAKNLLEPLKSAQNLTDLGETLRVLKAGVAPLAFEEALELYWKTPKARQPGAQQQRKIMGWWFDFSDWAKEVKGLSNLLQVDSQIARDYVAMIRETGRHVKAIAGPDGRRVVNFASGLSAKAANDGQAIIARVFEACLERAGLTKNPFDKIPRQLGDASHRAAFEPEELRLIGQEIRGDELLEPLVRICLGTGLRVGDAATLRWDEVDLKAGMIRRGTRKTGAVVGIPILPPLRVYLEGLTPEGEFVSEVLASQYLRNQDYLSACFKKLLARIGIGSQVEAANGRQRSVKDLHSLRHTFVWLAAEAGVPLPIVQSVVGHMSPEMTLHYANHATDKSKQEKFAVMPDYLEMRAVTAAPPEDELLSWIRTKVAEATPKTAWLLMAEIRERLEGGEE